MSTREAYVEMLDALSKAYRAEKMTWANMQETVGNMWTALQFAESKPKEE